MLVKIPILTYLASLAVADFDMFWFAENVLDVGVGAERYSGIEFLNKPPNCNDFVNGAQMEPGFGGDVSDSKHGGIACDGCPVNKNWKEWALCYGSCNRLLGSRIDRNTDVELKAEQRHEKTAAAKDKKVVKKQDNERFWAPGKERRKDR